PRDGAFARSQGRCRRGRERGAAGFPHCTRLRFPAGLPALPADVPRIAGRRARMTPDELMALLRAPQAPAALLGVLALLVLVLLGVILRVRRAVLRLPADTSGQVTGPVRELLAGQQK